jgi:hypothetical protein
MRLLASAVMRGDYYARRSLNNNADKRQKCRARALLHRQKAHARRAATWPGPLNRPPGFALRTAPGARAF